MSDSHNHAFIYTVTFRGRHWWGGARRKVFAGIGTNKQGDELIIALSSGGFISLNFREVLFMVASPVDKGGHS